MNKHPEYQILVTGGTGFLGSCIIQALWNAGYTSLHAVSRGIKKPTLPAEVKENVRWHQADLSDIGALEDLLSATDVVVHAAGPSPFDQSNTKNLIRNLYQGTENLVNLSLERGIKKFIHLSSVAALGIRKKQEFITEEQIFTHSRYDSPFGLAKFITEQTVWRAHAEGLPVSILNPGYVLGAGDWQHSSAQLWPWLAKKPIFFPEGSTAWVGSSDVAQAVLKLIEGDYSGRRFILSAENLSFEHIFSLIATEAGVRPPATALRSGVKFLLNTMKVLQPRLFAKQFFFYDTLGQSLFTKASYSSELSAQALGVRYKKIQDVISVASLRFRKSTF